MVVGKCISCKKMKFKDGSVNHKLLVLIDGECGILWSKHEFAVDDDVPIGVKVDGDYKFKLYVADR